jgi:UDP-N-acetylglucosamine:LPS N-acetylglucosamine transferase
MKKKIIAVASGGGHWKELMLIKSAFENENVKCLTTIKGLPEEYGFCNSNIINDANKRQPIKLAISFLKVLYVIYKFKPDVVISTGAAIGVFSIIIGRFMKAKTIWIDSIANTNKLSLSGRLIVPIAHHVLTQWEDISDGQKITYFGAVL